MPTTGFEDRVAAEARPDWTSLAEEVAFLDAVVALGDRVSYESVGKSVENRDIWLVRVGIGSNLDARPKVLIVAQQHGPELAGREASLEIIRRLQTTADSAEVAYLSNAAVYFMPTCNPDGWDGWDGGSRNNANNIDINRHHCSLQEPEVRIIHEVIRDYRPAIVIDSHEANNVQFGNGVDGMEFNRTLITQAHQSLRDEGDHIVNDLLRPAITALGFAQGIYAGSIANRANLGNSSGLRHCVGLLFETSRRPSSDPNVPARANRVLMQRTAMEVVIGHHAANVSELEALRAGSIEGKTSDGRGRAAIDFQNSTVVNPAPIAYRVTPAQRSAVENHFNTWEVSSFRDGDDYIVPLGQEAQPILPFAFDAASNIADGGNVIAATRVTSLDPFTSIRRLQGGEAVKHMPRGPKGRGWVETRVRSVDGESWS